jgi:hypothetical protein
VLSAYPREPAASSLLEAAVSRLGKHRRDPDWPWPEPRLAYDNGRLAQARIAASVALGDQQLLDEGCTCSTG